MTDDPAIVAAGGWCAPADMSPIYSGPDPDAWPAPALIEMPEVSVARVGISFDAPTLAEQAARDGYQAFVRRVIDATLGRRHQAEEFAAFAAYLGGWDLHLYDPPEPSFRHDDASLHRLSFVGIEFVERERDLPFPTIFRHRTDESWSDWWEEE